MSDPNISEDFQEWLEALENTMLSEGSEYATKLLERFYLEAKLMGIDVKNLQNLPFKNSVLYDDEIPYPGDWEKEEKIRHIIRWNSLVTVLNANKDDDLGGHISTYSSAATLYEVGFNHFFRGSNNQLGDLVYFQGHSSPGIYARAFLEGRIKKEQLENFRREIGGEGVSSYPHPWLMPDFWQFPTVSMGLGPIFGIYQAHVMRYLENRDLIKKEDRRKVWVFCGDGEMDEPESMGAISLAARENLDNLVFVVNCNLQRLDGPVRGNSKIITELGRQFSGAGWNVVNLIWGRKWDDLINGDSNGVLQKIMDDTVDGEYQNFKSKGGKYTRDNFFAKDPEALKMVENFTDDEIEALNRGGHDPQKIYNAYSRAYDSNNRPTVILAFTIKGYGIGSRQADNTTHQVKKLTSENIKDFIENFNLPVKFEENKKLELIDLEDKPDLKEYLVQRRNELGGYLPERKIKNEVLKFDFDALNEFDGTQKRDMSTTMVFVRILTKLMRDKYFGNRVVPIVPDEARTFGMDGLFRQFGIYSSEGQKYEPVDSDQVMFYKESKSGRMLEEGINEAGAFSAWLALATSYATNNLPMVPMYIYYSMFGFQRIHDLAWAAGDSRAKGFLLGATSGRTTLNGEGLQHQDGHSHLFASTIPNCKSYDPCYSYELAAIISSGIKEMYEDNKDIYYYITLMNENYSHPEKPKGLSDIEILNGAYCLEKSKNPALRILASGLTLNFALAAKKILEEFGLEIDVWSITSFNELYKGGIEGERNKRLKISDELSYVESCFKENIPTIAVSDYQRAYSNQIRQWVSGEYVVLGTDGYGRSDTREKLREFFEINEEHIVYNALLLLKMSDDAKNFRKQRNLNIRKLPPWKT